MTCHPTADAKQRSLSSGRHSSLSKAQTQQAAPEETACGYLSRVAIPDQMKTAQIAVIPSAIQILTFFGESFLLRYPNQVSARTSKPTS